MRRPLRGWRLVLFARCEHTERAESDEWDGPIETDRWWASRLHRLSCRPCRRSRRLMNWLRRRLADMPASVRRQHLHASESVLSEAAAARIRESLAEARRDDS